MGCLRRLDVASRVPKSVGWSSAFLVVVLGSFFNHPLPAVVRAHREHRATVLHFFFFPLCSQCALAQRVV